MQIGQLKAAIASYVTGSSTPNMSLFINGGTDLLVLALNQARTSLEQQVDFEYNKILVNVVMDPMLGVDLGTAVEHTDNTTPIAVNKVRAVYFQPPNPPPNQSISRFHNLRFISKDGLSQEVREETFRWRGWGDFDWCRYPAYPDQFNSSHRIVAYQDGTRLYVYPNAAIGSGAQPFTLNLDVIKWLPDYVATVGTCNVEGSTALAGTYTQNGTFNGQPLFQNLGVGYIWFTGTNWILAATLGDPLASPRWTSATNDLESDYSPTGATDTAVISFFLGADTTEDFICKYAHQFLLWEGIIQVNYLTRQFTPRTEGNIPAPEKLRDLALQRIVAWNADLVRDTAWP